MKFSTKIIHEGFSHDEQTGAIMPPIYMTSTFVQESPAKHKGYDYTRAGNPNFTILEKVMASIENAPFATVFSSGLGALTALIATLNPGDRVCTLGGLYGGTFRLFSKEFSRFGISLSCFGPKEIDKALELNPKWILFESPTNPLLEIIDIKQAVEKAKNMGALVVVDNTFATPYFQNPIDLGADVVWHSTTKYIGGHSDVIGGALIVKDPNLKKELDFHRMAIGLNPSPFDAWLTLRGLKTLAVRMRQHEANAAKVAQFLAAHPHVKRVYYPGLESHPDHKIAKEQMSGFSGMVSCEFNFTLEETKKRISHLKVFSLAESLGGVESLVNHPASMTHASIPPSERERLGIGEGLVRFSCGIEDSQDLIDDLAASFF